MSNEIVIQATVDSLRASQPKHISAAGEKSSYVDGALELTEVQNPT